MLLGPISNLPHYFARTIHMDCQKMMGCFGENLFFQTNGEQGLFSAMVVLEVGIIFKQILLDMGVLKNDLKQEPFSIKWLKTEK